MPKSSIPRKSIAAAVVLITGGAGFLWLMGTGPEVVARKPRQPAANAPTYHSSDTRSSIPEHQVPHSSVDSAPLPPKGAASAAKFVPLPRSLAKAAALREPATLVSPESAGARLTTGGQSVTVESYTGLPGQTGPALTVAIVPQPPESAPGQALARTPVLSYEDELFRTKWGWAAWQAVQRAAREEAQLSQ